MYAKNNDKDKSSSKNWNLKTETEGYMPDQWKGQNQIWNEFKRKPVYDDECKLAFLIAKHESCRERS